MKKLCLDIVVKYHPCGFYFFFSQLDIPSEAQGIASAGEKGLNHHGC